MRGENLRERSPEERREAASKGGKTAWKNGTAHKFTPEKAREAAYRSAAARRLKAMKAEGLSHG